MLRRLTAHKLPFSPFLRGKLRIFCYDFLNVAENRTMYQARHASRSNNSNWHFVFFVYQKTFNYLCKDDYLIRIIKFVEQNGISQRNLIAWREFRTEKDTYI